MNKRHLKNRQAGYSLVEIVIVVGLIALALVGLGIFVRQYTNTNTANDMVQNLAVLQSAMRHQNSGNATYPTTLTEASIINKAPDDLVNAAGTGLIAPWGAPIDMDGGADYNGGVDNGFTTVLNDAPSAQCNDILLGVRRSYQVITVNGAANVVRNEADGTEAGGNAIAGFCTGDANDITLITAGG